MGSAGPHPTSRGLGNRSDWGQPHRVQQSEHAGFPRLSTPGLTTGHNFLPSPFPEPTAPALGWALGMRLCNLPCFQEAPRLVRGQGQSVSGWPSKGVGRTVSRGPTTHRRGAGLPVCKPCSAGTCWGPGAASAPPRAALSFGLLWSLSSPKR